MKNRGLGEIGRRSPLFRGLGDRQIKSIARHFHIHRLEKGSILFRAEQRSRVMYVVLDGKLRVEKVTEARQVVRIASLLPGDVVGEVALLTGEKHSGQVRALTDAHLAGIAKPQLDKVLRQYPQLLHNLTRIEALRLRNNIVRENKTQHELGFVLHLYATTDSDYQAAQPAITAAVSREEVPGFSMLTAALLRGASKDMARIRERVSQSLLRNASTYLHINVADYEPEVVRALVLMSDRLVLTLSEDQNSLRVVRNLLTPPAIRSKLRMENPVLVLVHHASRDNVTVGEIEQRLGLTVRYRLRLRRDFWQSNDLRYLHMQCTTIARLILRSTQGIAFGGGGARALSEIGIISELERHKIEFDHVAGTSMGALIASFYAQGLSSREMSEKFREFLPSDKGLLRYNLPFVSFFRDRNINRILRRLFGKLRIEDLPRPLTIISADLITGKEIRMQKGLVWRAIRASMSLPVIFAPVRYHGYYLVDGGAINNVPGNVLREQGVGKILGINCTPLEDNTVREYLAETNLFQLLKPGDRFWSNLRRFARAARLFVTRPPILQIANRAMMLEGSELVRQKSREFDLLLSPNTSEFGLFEFERREEIIDAGRYHAQRRVHELKKKFRRS